MDTITHGLIGVIGSRAGFSQRAGRIATISFLIGALFPDLDIVVSLLGPAYSLKYHRGITHSIIAAPLFSFLIAAVIYRLSAYKNLKSLFLMVALGIYSHILFDLITSYGTLLFYPLSVNRYSWNLVFIIDPFISLSVLLGLVLCWRMRDKAFTISAIVLSILAFYLIICLCIKLAHEDRLKGFSEINMLAVKRSTIYPKPLSPLFWMGVVETCDSYYQVDISALRGGVSGFKRIVKENDNFFIDSAKRLRISGLYYW
ncbi:MAG: metal-dependent hydrolase, partial [Thermodesulfobacteriota bacterium]